MKNMNVIILIFCFAMVMAFVAGCTTNAPSSPAAPRPSTEVPVSTVTAAENPVPSVVPTPAPSGSPTSPLTGLKQFILSPADFPDGYSLIYEGEMVPGDENCTADRLCYLEGYSLSMVTGDANNSTLVDHMVSRYSKPVTPETLNAILADQLPEIASGTPTMISAPSLGDGSAAYRFEFPSPEVPVQGYLVIFGRGDLYEIIMVIGTDANERLAFDLARKSADKLA